MICGIDPGLDGGLAFLGEDGIELAPMPTFQGEKKRTINILSVVLFLEEHQLTCRYRNTELRVFLEDVHARPGQGVTSMFNFGNGLGQLQGALAALRIPVVMVRPQEWQKSVMVGAAKGTEAAVASRLFPCADWLYGKRFRVPHSGMVDAALIAEYGRRVTGGAA